MPRQPRLDAPITLHHGMVRGSERTALFRDDGDRTELVTRLAALVPVTGLTVSAWAPPLIACIEQPEVIEKILTHLGVWPSHVHSPPAGVPVAISPATGLIAA